MEKSSGRSKNKPETLVPITLRIPGSVHARLKKISESEYRSLNHQIILALTYFLDAHEKRGGLHDWLSSQHIVSGTGSPQSE